MERILAIWDGPLLRLALSVISLSRSAAAAVYYFASRKLRLLVERPVLCGLFYGELVFLFMYFVVIPLSAIGHPQYNIATYITGPIGHPLLVGLPIALCVRRFSAERPCRGGRVGRNAGVLFCNSPNF